MHDLWLIHSVRLDRDQVGRQGRWLARILPTHPTVADNSILDLLVNLIVFIARLRDKLPHPIQQRRSQQRLFNNWDVGSSGLISQR
jgi:hypothetical protein